MKIKSIYSLNELNVIEKDIPIFTNSNRESCLVNIYDLKKEKILGFGGALTESSAYNYNLLSNEDKNVFLEQLVGDRGLRYNLFRLTIGSSDFARKSYCYLENESLDSFNIDEDRKYLIPFIKDVIKTSKEAPFFLASAWSAPSFMKTNNERNHGGHLKKEYYDLYAEYIIKFIEEYKKEGITINALTIQNEPKATQSWESCVFPLEEEINFSKVLKKHLNSKNIDVMLFCWDHNKERLFDRASNIYSSTDDIFTGSAFHWYSGDHFGAIKALKTKYPNKVILETEFCKSSNFDETDSTYAHEILNNLDSGANGIIEWNVLLDQKGGPYHDRGSQVYAGCDAPFRLDENNRLINSRIYFEMYMFSHFIDKKAYSLFTSSFSKDVEISAFKNPNGEIVVNILNNSKFENIGLFIKDKICELNLEKGSLTTVVIENDN